MKNMKLCITALLCFVLICGAVSAATISVNPSHTDLGKGESVQLAVGAEDVEQLGSYDIDVTWNPVLVSLSDVTKGSAIDTMEKNIQTARVRIAGLNATLDGITGSAVLCYLNFTAVNDNGLTSPVAVSVNNYGFLNSTSGEDIPVDGITNATITTQIANVVDARIGVPGRTVPVDEETTLRATVTNRRSYDTSPLDINVTIVRDGVVEYNTTYNDVELGPSERFTRTIAWTPTADGRHLVNITVTSEDIIRGRPTDEKVLRVIGYELNYTNDLVYGYNRAQVNNWFYMGAYVTANQPGRVNLTIDAPDCVTVYRGNTQTRYLYNSHWNFVSVWMRASEPGVLLADEFNFTVSAHNKSDSIHGKDITIFVPSIQVKSVNSSRVSGASTEATMTYNTLHTNNTHRNVTKLVAQSGSQGRTLSGLGYLVRYPYGCVEQITSRMLAALNVKNYYLGRDDKPSNFADIRNSTNDSVSSGIDRLVKGGQRGQHSDGGWSLWGYGDSESSSSSYGSYTLAKINSTDEDLRRLLEGKISRGSTVDTGTVNFDKLIEWFHANPDDPSSGTWSWRAPVCHAWTAESNTPFIMLIHDMINRTADVQDPYRGYMEGNMRNATKYVLDNQQADGSFSTGNDKAMTTALSLWGLESFGLTSAHVSEADITLAKSRAAVYLIGSQEPDGSWAAGTCYGWYSKGRISESTAYALLALNATGVPNDNETITRGVGWLVDTYESSGSWGYTWATQASIDALISCQGSVTATGTMDVYIDDRFIHTFTLSGTNPREVYELTSAQMDTMMAEGILKRDIFGDGWSTVKYHDVRADLTAGEGPIVLSVENSQWAPLNEIDNTIRWSHVIQMEGEEDGNANIAQINRNIGILAETMDVDDAGYHITFDASPSPMVENESADVTIGVTSDEDVFSPMIEVPIEGFSFDNSSIIYEDGVAVSYEVLNSTVNVNQDSIFIEPDAWVKDTTYSYRFTLTPAEYGTLNLSVRIIPLNNEDNVAYGEHAFDVTGRGTVTISVQDEDYTPVIADTITVNGVTVNNVASHDFDGLLEDTYTLFVNKTDYPNIHGTVDVRAGETSTYNVTLPTTMTDPVLILSEGGAGSIAGVAQIAPEQLNALTRENTTYNISVMGNGGELGVALEFQMRYLVNDPVVTLNGRVLGEDEYDFINGTFAYGDGGSYTGTNATLVVYNATSGTNYIGMTFDGDVLGDAYEDGLVDSTDALYILHYVVGNIDGFTTYSYPDVFDRNSHTIDSTDALLVLHKVVGNVNKYYQ